jgi:cysteine desulfuration protein SufE
MITIIILKQLDMVTPPQPLPPNLERIVQRFQQITEPKRRYEHLLWFAKRLPELSEEEQIGTNKVPGCVSQVYITAEVCHNSVTLRGTSDAQITKGLVGLLIEGLNGLAPNEILQLTPDFIQRTGLDTSLTPSRSNGFYNIFRFMQQKVAISQISNTSLLN